MAVLDPLVPSTAEGKQMLLISLAERLGDSSIQAVAVFDFGVDLLMRLPLGLHQQIIADKILKAAIFSGVLAEMLPKGAVETALVTVHGCVVSAGFIITLEILGICWSMPEVGKRECLNIS